MSPLNVKVENVPSEKEIIKLIHDIKDIRIKLLVELLVKTGMKISEALDICKSDIKVDQFQYIIKIIKQSKKWLMERTISIQKDLIDRINSVYQGKKYLFEHDNKQYSRIAMSNRIGIETLKIIGKEYRPQAFRHYFAIKNIKQNGLSYTSRHIGHASISTTAFLYECWI